MHVVVRNYEGSGASEPSILLEQREDEVKDLIGSVPASSASSAFRTDGGGTTVTICEQRTGTDEYSRRAADWVTENGPAAVSPPGISEGTTVLHF